MKRNFDYNIEEYDNIKKKKIDIEFNSVNELINNLEINNDSFNLNESNEQVNNLEINNNYINSINNYLFNNDLNKINDKILIKIFQIRKITNSNNFKLTFNKYIQLFNIYINSLDQNKYILGYYSKDLIKKNFFIDYISIMIYPYFLIYPFLLNKNFYESKEIDYINIDKNKKLIEICETSKTLFPTWKKRYNIDIDYNFESMNKINKKICINFTKKIFNFYEKIYGVYFNIIIGNLFSYILSNYILNLIDPYDNKFILSIFNNWVITFNEVLSNCKTFILEYALTINLDNIDLDDKQTLIYKMNKIKKDFIDDFDDLNDLYYFDKLKKSNNPIIKLFQPFEKFKNLNNNRIKSLNIKYIKPNCLNNIDNEIENIFRLKNYIKLMDGNSWIKKFYYKENV